MSDSGDSKGVVCLMDDIGSRGKYQEEHNRRLEEVLNKLESSGMTLNRDKCEFGVFRSYSKWLWY